MSRFQGAIPFNSNPAVDDRAQPARSRFSGAVAYTPPQEEEAVDVAVPSPEPQPIGTPIKPGAADDLQPVDPNRGPGRPAEKSGAPLSPAELDSMQQAALADNDVAKATRIGDIKAIRETEGIPGEDPAAAKQRKFRESMKGRTVEWDGKQVPIENVFKAADSMGLDPASIMRAGTTAGKFEAQLAKSVFGQTMLRAQAGFSDLAATAVSLGARAVGRDDVVQNLKRSQALRGEYLNLIEKGGQVEDLLTPRGSRIYSGVVQSLTKVAATGAVGGAAQAPGQVAILSGLAAENLDTGLNEADDLGLSGSDRTNYAMRKAAIETGITYAMGAVGKSLGISTVEEMLSPGMRQAASNLVTKSGIAKQLANLAGFASSAGMEAGEEMLVDVVQQINTNHETGNSIDYTQLIDAGISGAVAGGGVKAIQGINTQLGRKLNNTNVEETVKGVKAAEAAIETTQADTDPSAEANAARIVEHVVAPGTKAETRGVKQGLKAAKSMTPETLAKLKAPMTSKEFAKLTGLKKTSKAFRESFAQTVDVYSNVDKSQAVQPENAPATPTEGATPTPVSDPVTGPESDGVKTAEATAQGVPATPGSVVAMAETTSARRNDIDANREFLGLPAIPDADSRAFEETLNQANKMGIPEKALDLSQTVIDKPRALSDIETAGIVVKAVEIKNRFNDATDRLNAAVTVEDQAIVANELSRIEGEFDTISTALRTSGTEKGRALNAQKLTLNDRYELISVLNRAKVANGGKDIDSESRRKLTESAKRHASLTERMNKKGLTPDEQQLVRMALRNTRTEIAIRTDAAVLRGKKGLDKAWGHMVDKSKLLRNMMATFDLSGIARQGGFLLMSSPKDAWNAKHVIFKVLDTTPTGVDGITKGDIEAENALQKLKDRPLGKLGERSGLFLHDEAVADFTKREENIARNGFRAIADAMPEGAAFSLMTRNLSRFASISEGTDRVFGAYLNEVRAASFDRMVQSLPIKGEPTQIEAEAIAEFVNVATGRGGFGKYEDSVSNMADLFFAPRYAMSRFQLLLGSPLRPKKVDPNNTEEMQARKNAQKVIAREYMRSATGLATFAAMALAAFPDDVEFTMDPRHPDAFKLKVGDTRIDFLFGMAQPARMIGRLLMQEKLSGGKVRDLNSFDEVTSFLRKKFSPPASLVMDLVAGDDAIGREIDRTNPAELAKMGLNRMFPLVLQDLAEQGVPLITNGEESDPKAAALSLLNIIGLGVQTYDNQLNKK